MKLIILRFELWLIVVKLISCLSSVWFDGLFIVWYFVVWCGGWI